VAVSRDNENVGAGGGTLRANSAEGLRLRARILDGFGRGDVAFRLLTQGAAVLVIILLGGVFVSLIQGALPAIQQYGFGFLTSQHWNPASDPPNFGGLPAIYGTLVTSAIAMLIAVPIGVGIAVFLTELCPIRLRRPIGTAVELLAGVPSIIYGIWGLFVFAPFLQKTLQPWLIAACGHVPLLSNLFAGPPYGIGIFTAGLVLSIMVIPFVCAISRDVFDTVPAVNKEAAYGLGCTKWEVVKNVVIPHTRTGILGGVMLGLGRALGETMAVTFVIGNAHHIRASLLSPGTSISATIANEFTEADKGLYTSSLFLLALILFVITFIILAIARYMLMRIERRQGS
jgi:phosphate transport system permease protein